MKENSKETKKGEEPKKKRLSEDSTVLLTLAGTLLAIVVFRGIYWILTGI